MIRYNPQQPLGKTAITKHCKDVAKAAGVEEWNRVTLDTFRPFSLSVVANSSGVNAKMVAEVARHSSIATQAAYVRTSDEQQLAACNALQQCTVFPGTSI